MKRLVMISSLLALMGSLSVAAPAPSASGPKRSDRGESCRKIKAACSDAGFELHGAEGKRLYKDCVRPLMDGKTVAGVNISPETVESCRAHGRQGS